MSADQSREPDRPIVLLRAFREIYFLVSVLPFVAFLAVLVYAKRLKQTAPDLAALTPLLPTYASLFIGTVGVVLIMVSRKRSEAVAGLIVATAIAFALFLWELTKVLSFYARPLLIWLGAL